MSYTKHGRGAAGVGSTRRFGDFGIEQLRQRDARIIESLKLQKAQETQRSKDLISQQKDVDRTELGVEEDIQQLIQDRYQNALAATKLRGRQEGQKGRDEARMIKENAQPRIKMWQQVGGMLADIGIAGIEKGLEQQALKEQQEAYDDVDPEDTALKTSIINFQFNKDAQDSEKVKHLSSYIANTIQIGTPLMTSAGQSGSAMGLTDKIDLLQSQAVTQLIEAGITPNASNVEQYLKLRFKSLGKAYGLIDKNGEWISNKHILNLQRNWNIKANQISLNFNNAEVQRLNEQSRNVTYGELSTELTADNLFKASIVWTFRPQEKDHKSFHTMADGVEQTFMRLAGDKKVLKRDALKLGNQVWIESKPGPNFGKPNAKGETYFQKFPELEQQFIKERTTWENQWKSDTTAAKKEADRLDNIKVVRPLLDTYKGEDLSDLITEMTMKHGKDSTTVTNLKLLQKGSIANWDSKRQKEILQECKINMDHDCLIAMRNSSELTGEARREWNDTYLPLLGPLKKSGWSSKQFKERLETKLKSRLKLYDTTSLKPETLDAAVVKAIQDWWEKYESVTTGPNATAVAGSADAIKKADDWLWDEIDDENGTFAVLSSADRKGRAPAEFSNFLPGGVSWKDSEKYSISTQEYNQRVAELGEVEAAKSDGVVSKEHIQHVARQIASGKSFEPLPFTANIKGLTRQEFYQHHIDQLGLKTKIVVPEDFKSSVKKDTAYDLSLKRQIEHVRTINGFWKTLTTEAEGTRPTGPEDDRINFSVKAGLMEAIENNTSTVETGRTTVNTNNTLTFESPFAADSLSYFGKQGLNMIEVQTLPNYYGDTIRAAGSAQDWLFNSGQTDWYFIPGEVPGLPGSWRYRD